MKTLFLFFLLMPGMLQVNAQKLYASLENETGNPHYRSEATTSSIWEFSSALRDYTRHRYAKADEQTFGRDIACLLALADEKFIQKKQIIAGDPQLQAGIHKPIVYNSLKNITRYYRQKNRAGVFTQADAGLFAHVVKVALACIGDDTEDFEKALKKSKKSPQQQLDCFRKVKLINIYE